MRPVGLTSNAWTNGFGESCAAIVSNNASAGSPSLDSSSTWALRRRSPIAWLLPAKAGGVSRWPARYIRRCRRTGSHPRVSHLWSTSMTRYNIEETAVYDKYVRWCGRTGPRGPSYPIRANFSHLLTLGAIRLRKNASFQRDLDVEHFLPRPLAAPFEKWNRRLDPGGNHKQE